MSETWTLIRATDAQPGMTMLRDDGMHIIREVQVRPSKMVMLGFDDHPVYVFAGDDVPVLAP